MFQGGLPVRAASLMRARVGRFPLFCSPPRLHRGLRSMWSLEAQSPSPQGEALRPWPAAPQAPAGLPGCSVTLTPALPWAALPQPGTSGLQHTGCCGLSLSVMVLPACSRIEASPHQPPHTREDGKCREENTHPKGSPGGRRCRGAESRIRLPVALAVEQALLGYCPLQGQ